MNAQQARPPAGPLRLQIITPNNSVPAGLPLLLKAERFFFRGAAQPQDVTQAVQWSCLPAPNSACKINSAPTSVTATQPGTITVIAVSGPLRAAASIAITPPLLLSISIAPPDPNLSLSGNNSQQKFTATGNCTNGQCSVSVTWNSSNTGTASVDSTGMATAAASGTTTITATDAATKISGQTGLNVGLQSISILPAAPGIPAGDTQQFTAMGTFQGLTGSVDVTNAVQWNSSNFSVATIDPATGLAASSHPGTTVISASSGFQEAGLTSGSTVLTVGPPVVKLVAVTPAPAAVAVGATQQFTATAIFTDGTSEKVTNQVAWSAAPQQVASISAGGLAQGLTIGTATITATLTLLSGAQFFGDAQLGVRPTSRFAFLAAGDNTIAGYALNQSTGALRLAGYFFVPDNSKLAGFATDPAGAHLYAGTAGPNIHAFSIERDGELAELNGSPFTPGLPGVETSVLAINPAGTFLFAADITTPEIFTFQIDPADGSLVRVPATPVLTGANPRQLTINGNFLYCANAGAGGDAGSITAYSIASDGSLTQIKGSPFTAGLAAPSSLALDPSGKFLLVSNRAGNSILVFSLDPVSGNLSLIGSPHSVGRNPSSVLVNAGKQVAVANSGDGTISTFSLNPDGSLASAPGSPFAASGASALAFDAPGFHLYATDPAANEEEIFSVDPGTAAVRPRAAVRTHPAPVAVLFTPGAPPVYRPALAVVADSSLNGGLILLRIDPAQGSLTPADFVPVATGLFRVATDLPGRFAYAVDRQCSGGPPCFGNTYQVAVNPQSTFGSLAQLAAGQNPDAVTVEPSGRFIYAANLGSGNVSSYFENAGAFTSLGAPVLAGVGPFAVAADPTGRFLYVANNGGPQGGSVSVYNISPATGDLAHVSDSPVPGSQPVAIAVHPSGRFAAVVSGSGTGAIGIYSIDAISGALSAAGAALSLPADLTSAAFSPDGNFLFVAANGNVAAQQQPGIFAFAFDPDSGALHAIPGSPFSSAANPSALAVDPSDNFLYVTNRSAGQVSVYSIDPTTGALTPQPSFPLLGTDLSLAPAPNGISIIGSVN